MLAGGEICDFLSGSAGAVFLLVGAIVLLTISGEDRNSILYSSASVSPFVLCEDIFL
ncbi:hypothetical protein BRADI_5g03655v3 [Brachypodium distachyon]|uniref:Uncharacterized protein n=1 Tax=Brachypodium distachyon TaxID=15368 RepID=A0A0Q3NZS3_BRADI|nr:hypothetical protein BRADI_5g03655v3 [Brachypodium distachyon]